MEAHNEYDAIAHELHPNLSGMATILSERNSPHEHGPLDPLSILWERNRSTTRMFEQSRRNRPKSAQLEAFSKNLGRTDISTLVVPRDGSRRLFAGTQAAGLWMRRLDRVAQ